MALFQQNHHAAAIAKMRRQRAKFIKSFNEGKRQRYLQMYTLDATLYDPDLHVVAGMKSMSDYFSELFEYAQERGRPEMMLKSKRTIVKGRFVYDMGEYYWSTVRCGRYIHKWAWINDNYYLTSDRFTIDRLL
uniref:Nuclear transport factor 2 family protein n=1 Tax=Plectus sambesii TaxID=2011161 RepID=A0A914VQG7_9BILA